MEVSHLKEMTSENELWKRFLVGEKRKRPVCQNENCSRKAYYNYRGLKEWKFCSYHKLPQMVNLNSVGCAFEGCEIKPCYNFQGEKARFCSKHKLPEMVNVYRRICQFPGCDKRAFCNFKGEKRGIYCSLHREPGMIDILNRRCQVENCGKLAIYNFKELPKSFCSKHRHKNMVRYQRI